MSEEILETTESEHRNRSLVIGGILVLLLLVGAAFVGGRLLNQAQAQTAVTDGLEPASGEVLGQVTMLEAGPGGESRQTISLDDITPAPELPTREPDERGLYVSRQDDTITIGTGEVRAVATQGQAPEFNYSGIAVEVLVTNQTELYEDTSRFTPGQSEPLQQTVEPLDNLDDVGDGTTGQVTVQVWGRREGDRIVAETIVIVQQYMMAGRPLE